MLEKAQYSVKTTRDGEQALKLLKTFDIDLVMLDLNMPGLDGFELLKRMRALLPGLRIVATSGYLGGGLLPAAAVLGATTTLPKTDAPKMLLPTVRKLLLKRSRR